MNGLRSFTDKHQSLSCLAYRGANDVMVVRGRAKQQALLSRKRKIAALSTTALSASSAGAAAARNSHASRAV